MSKFSDFTQDTPVDTDHVVGYDAAAGAGSDRRFLFSAIKAWIQSWIAKADVGLANVDNTSDATKNAAAATLTNKTLTTPVINSPTGIVKADVGLGNVDNTSDAAKNAAAATLTNKTIDAASNTVANLATANFAAGVVDADAGLAANSDTRLATQRATKTYVDQIVAANDAMVFKGVVDASTNPNYPAADRGATYKISVAGKIGGASGPNVEIGDLILCTADATAAGDHVTVGASWVISQTNLDGAVIGPASSTGGNIATFNGASGKLIADGGKALPAGAVVGTTDTQTLTNKTLTSPVINTPTGIVKGDVGLGSVPNVDATNAANISTGSLPLARLTDFVGSGASHARGIVPDPGVTGGTTKFLREDATWQVPAGGGGGAPTDAEYITAASNAGLSAERVLTDTTSVAWDFTTAGQAKANVPGLVRPVYDTGRYYTPEDTLPGGVTTNSANVIYATPCRITRALTIDELGFKDGGGTSGVNSQMAIYRADGTNNRPGTLVVATGNITQGVSAAALTAAITPTLLEPGIYWFCANQDGSSAKQGINNISASILRLVGSALAAGMLATPGGGGFGIHTATASQTFGTWPADLTATSFTDSTSSSTSAPAPILGVQ